MLDPTQRARIRDGFADLTTEADAFALDFYTILFAMAPEIRDLFPDDIQSQANKLQQTLVFLVMSVDNIPEMVGVLEDLGALHVEFETTDAHYDLLGEALLRTLAQHIPDWNDEDIAAWSELYRIAAEAMIDGARKARRNAALRIPA